MADWNTLSAGRWRRPSIIRQAQTWNLRVYQEHARIIPARGAPPGDTPNRTPDTASQNRRRSAWLRHRTTKRYDSNDERGLMRPGGTIHQKVCSSSPIKPSR
jgi:hypothetical protein